jgi:hypothetical protein
MQDREASFACYNLQAHLGLCKELCRGSRLHDYCRRWKGILRLVIAHEKFDRADPQPASFYPTIRVPLRATKVVAWRDLVTLNRAETISNGAEGWRREHEWPGKACGLIRSRCRRGSGGRGGVANGGNNCRNP